MLYKTTHGPHEDIHYSCDFEQKKSELLCFI